MEVIKSWLEAQGGGDSTVAGAQSSELQAQILKCMDLGHGNIYNLSQESRAVLGSRATKAINSPSAEYRWPQVLIVQINNALKHDLCFPKPLMAPCIPPASPPITSTQSFGKFLVWFDFIWFAVEVKVRQVRACPQVSPPFI